MRLFINLIACCAMAYCYESKNPLKVKKYKCIEIPDDVEIQLVPKRRGSTWQAEEQFRSIGSAQIGEQPISEENIETPQAHKRGSTWQAEEQFRSIGSAHIGKQPIPEDKIETPQAHKMLQGKHIKAGAGASLSKPREIPRDKNGRPLLLSPSHCKQVTHYATQYGVTDVLKWVERNCTFAKMFLPTATCEEINTLVASCYSQNYL